MKFCFQLKQLFKQDSERSVQMNIVYPFVYPYRHGTTNKRENSSFHKRQEKKKKTSKDTGINQTTVVKRGLINHNLYTMEETLGVHVCDICSLAPPRFLNKQSMFTERSSLPGDGRSPTTNKQSLTTNIYSQRTQQPMLRVLISNKYTHTMRE